MPEKAIKNAGQQNLYTKLDHVCLIMHILARILQSKRQRKKQIA